MHPFFLGLAGTPVGGGQVAPGRLRAAPPRG